MTSKCPRRCARIALGGTEAPLRVYDTSGPRQVDVREGLPLVRHEWITGRGDVAEGPRQFVQTSWRREMPDALGAAHARRTARHRGPRADAAALRASRDRDAGDGIHRAARRARRRVRAQRGGARPRHHPGQHQPSRARADGDRPELPRQDQREHRQLRRHLVDRGGSREAALGHALGRRHGDGPVDRQGHPRDARVDPAQLARADRHRADLSGARESRRTSRKPDVGGVSRHAHRAGRAGRGLLHRPRRRSAALHPDDRSTCHRHRLARRLDHGQVVSRAPQGELPLHALPRNLRDHARLRRQLFSLATGSGRAPLPTPTTRRSSPS